MTVVPLSCKIERMQEMVTVDEAKALIAHSDLPTGEGPMDNLNDSKRLHSMWALVAEEYMTQELFKRLPRHIREPEIEKTVYPGDMYAVRAALSSDTSVCATSSAFWTWPIEIGKPVPTPCCDSHTLAASILIDEDSEKLMAFQTYCLICRNYHSILISDFYSDLTLDSDENE